MDSQKFKGLLLTAVQDLIFVYEEQNAGVKLSGMRSTHFKIRNGTKQGPVLLPMIFSFYRFAETAEKLYLGCHLLGMCYRACCYYSAE